MIDVCLDLEKNLHTVNNEILIKNYWRMCERKDYNLV